jgi:HSP20 family molecular chaperone IbpA
MTNTVQSNKERRTYTPHTDIYSSENGYEAQVELPGVEPDNLDITVERGVLVVRGETLGEKYERYEALGGSAVAAIYERHFRLTEAVDAEKVEAEFKDGLLILKLPKAEQALARKIPLALN